MKKVLKILLPVLLSITVVISIGWYFLKYDPGLTRDLLVSQARKLEANGNHSMATWFYNLAYRQSGEDASVAIELAEQYKSTGNYTKAEYTLTNAIKAGGSVDLYIALCRTYVEQDKLFDAVTMLNNIADPAIKTQIEGLRPSAPIPNKETGYYNEYISISLSAETGTIYATMNGEYPSQHTDSYATPLTLAGGETTIQALTISENGLVSSLSILDYTVGGVIEPIQLADPAIDLVVRELLKVSEDHVIYSNELWDITSFDVPKDAVNISDLSWMPFLQSLTICGAQLETLSPLSGLVSLETLVIKETAITSQDLQIIANLPKLTSLQITDCGLSGITELSGASNLINLDLSSNTIRDLTALSTMPYLQTVDLSHNALTSAEVLGGLTNLTTLDISFNSITSTAPLSACSNLTELDISSNLLTSLSGIEKLVSLNKLSASFNQITEANALSACTSIKHLDISNNAITDISALGGLATLEKLNFSYNKVSVLPTFSNASKLISINGSHNQLTSLAGLSGLSNLNYVYMDSNAGITSVSPLSKCYQLVEVSVYGTGVTDVSVLTDNDSNIKVNYSPI